MSNENKGTLLFPDHLSLGRNVLWIASVVLVYFAMARLSLSFVFEPEGIAAIWPPSGIFLSAILLTRRSLRPWLVGALFITDFIAEILIGTPWLVGFIYALALTGDAVLGAWLLLRFVGGLITFKRVRELVGWLVFSVLLSNALAALVAATAASQLLPGTSFWNSWKWWMATDGIGNLVITPLILSWAAWGKTRLRALHLKRVLEGAALFILLALLNYLTVARLSENDLYSVLLTYLTFPFLLWAALRFGVRGVASASFILTAIIIYFSFNGTATDNFFHGSSLDIVITVQLFLAIMIMSSLFLATVVTERHEVEEALRESEDKFKYVFDYSNVGKSLTLPSGEIQVNQTFCELLGYSSEELKNKRWQEITHPDDVELTQQEMKGLLSGEKDAARFIKRFLKKDGSVIWVDIRSSLRLDQTGKPLYFMTTLVDITERKQAEEAHKQSEERVAVSQKLLQDFTDNSTSLIYALDLDGRFLLINRRLESVFGVPRETFIAKTRESIFSPEIAEAHRTNDLQVIARREPITFEEENKEPDGLHVYLSVKFPLLDKHGNVYGIGGISTDITERKQFERTLQESETRLVEAQAVAHVGSWELSLVDKATWASAEAFQIYGLSRTSPYLSLELAQRIPAAEDRARLDAALQGLIREQRPYDEEFHIRRANDGEQRIVHSIAHLVFDANGTPTKVIGVLQDITERKLTEAKLAEQMQELRQWYSVTLGREMRVLELKEEVDEVLIRAGLPPRYANPVFDPDNQVRRVAIYGKDITEHKQTEEIIQKAQIELQRLLTESDQSRRALLSVAQDQKIAEDKTHRLNLDLERRVQERTLQFEVANKELEAFAYSVSHDLRAPLRSLDGFSKALVEDYHNQLDEQGKYYLVRIQEAADRMGQLIEDLLNLSRVTRREMNLEPVDLSSLALQIVDELQPQAAGRGIEVDITPNLKVHADRNLMKIALENLISNAYKFTGNQAQARIQVGKIEQPGENVFFVRDNGAGFDMAYADKLFTPFQRLHSVQEFPGTGIGLVIVQRIITRHGGRVWPEAAVDQGATFYFTIHE